MEKKPLVGLIAVVIVIAAIVAVVIFAGCIGTTTTIRNIEEHPDKYIGKRVTIEATTFATGRSGHTYGSLEGFWIGDKEHPFGYILTPSIFVKYEGDYPSLRIKDKWGRDIMYPAVEVTGIVRHINMRIGVEEEGIFYIDGESWKYIDQK